MNEILNRFKDTGISRKLAEDLSRYEGRQVNIMEVCGTHTMSIFRYGIRDILPEAIRLISGPGCPVCVTPASFIDAAVSLSERKDVTVCTFGDLLRVPGSRSSLAASRSGGADVRIVYSPLDSLEIAAKNPERSVVFISVGFETTTPVIALLVSKAAEKGISNFSILPANKTMPEALKLLSSDRSNSLNGFLYPGHVAAITGTPLFEKIAEDYGLPGVVTGFEPSDIMHALLTLSDMVERGEARVVNEYSRVVRKEGNPDALDMMYKVFESCDAIWRGLGSIPGSGLAVRKEYEAYDAWKVFGIVPGETSEPAGCMCGEVLKGKATPEDCRLFRKACTPESPVGACMVSSEGTCAAYYRYKQA